MARGVEPHGTAAGPARALGRLLGRWFPATAAQFAAGHRPALLVFEESLGAFGAESAFGGDRDLREPVYRDGETVRFANRPSDLDVPASPWKRPRVVYLQHPSDPNVWWTRRRGTATTTTAR
ncbi:alpha/beta-hydrolase family protein [Microbispora sp. ZYX-F-249]|uniref:Alpha/beta-hydrolase family protein n=1 Tax=Microbispora maris TaxID=3144104 RepID=A0ABV0AZ12_9ACTN